MNRKQQLTFGAMFFIAAIISLLASGSLHAAAQTFQAFRCADGSQFVAGFFEYDKRAHLQIDGKAVTLARRLALRGQRYSGAGITLAITATAATIKRPRRPATTCERT
jgi:Membrane-bound lysozyme-inhibitor of c-type lysozyme